MIIFSLITRKKVFICDLYRLRTFFIINLTGFSNVNMITETEQKGRNP